MKKSIVVLVIILLLLVGAYAYFNFFMVGKVNTENNTILSFLKSPEAGESGIELEEKKVEASIPIFMYHWVRDDIGDYPYPENICKPEEVEKQMRYLKENNYDVIWVTDIDSLQHYEKPVVLTFDDGWADVYLNVFPLAKELNMKICMYVITDLVGTNAYCTWDMLEEMRDSGLVQIDSHTLSHPYLDEISQSQVDDELINSKKIIKDKLGIDSKVICYPSGQQNDYVIKVAKENYDYGLLMLGGIFNYDSETSNMHKITRIYAKRSMSLTEFIGYCEQAKVILK